MTDSPIIKSEYFNPIEKEYLNYDVLSFSHDFTLSLQNFEF